MKRESIERMLNASVTNYYTRLDKVVTMPIPMIKYTYYLENGKPYNVLTKAGKVRKETERMVVTNHYVDDFGTVVIIARKYASKTTLEKFGCCCGHGGKMFGIGSISTSVALNPICMERAKDESSICHYCFAKAMLSQYDSLGKKLARNTEKLAMRILEPSELPLIDPAMYPRFRIESFGDLQSVEQAINYIEFIRVNSSIDFAWWTKNPNFIADAIEHGCSIPANVNIIYSSPKLNARTDVNALIGKYPFISVVFTVYEKEYALTHNIKINCGKRDCLNCKTGCYIPGLKNVLIVNELLK